MTYENEKTPKEIDLSDEKIALNWGKIKEKIEKIKEEKSKSS